MSKTTKKTEEVDSGLDQKFEDRDGQYVMVKDILSPSDSWILKRGKNQATIITHNGVKKIARVAGLSALKYEVLTQPNIQNNYQYTLQVTIMGRRGPGIGLGETNRSNLGNRGKNNPANMAEKRAFDRAVFDYLGITGLLSEDELPDNEDEKVEHLTTDEQKQIAPLLNQIFAAKKRADLVKFAQEMKKGLGNYSEKQVEYLRKIHGKQLALVEKSF
jgi:hypothetical protein